MISENLRQFVVISFSLYFFLQCTPVVFAGDSGWNTVVDSAEEVWDSAEKESKRPRINDLPGNPNDVDSANVWSAKAKEVYQERREILGKLKKLKEIEAKEKSKWIHDTEKIAAIESNRRRLNKRLDLLNKERDKRIKQGKWYGYVPENENRPPPPGPPPDSNWGGTLPEVSDINPTTMGRSEITAEMRQLNKERKRLRKRLDFLNSVGDFAGKIGQKAQVEDVLKKIIARIKALEAEKQHQIENGTWGYSSDDITRVGATKKQIDQAYKDGNELGKQLKRGELTSDEVRQATRDAYGRYKNNERLKKAFKKGFREGAS